MVRSMPQKKSLKQIERQQRRKEKEEAKSGGRVEKTIGALDIPEMSSEELMEQLRRMKAITPTGLAAQMNIKVSTAKKLLEELRGQRVINLASRSHNLKVYSLNQ
jgi:ribosomal protein S25